jgi:hypothetical protein
VLPFCRVYASDWDHNCLGRRDFQIPALGMTDYLIAGLTGEAAEVMKQRGGN